MDEQKKRVSETLSQREKAQRDIIELKKMQEGKIDPGPKPSEVELKPVTLKQKKDNFLYHHKYKLIAAVFIVAVLSVIIYQQVTRIRYDAKVVLFCYENIAQGYIDKIQDYTEQFYPDVNGNGSVDIEVIDCSYAKDSIGYQTSAVKATKLQALLAADPEAMLFIVDSDTLAFLNGLSEDLTLFDEQSLVKLSDDFYDAIFIADWTPLSDDMYLGIRTVKDTVLEKDAATSYEAAKQAFDKIRQANQ